MSRAKAIKINDKKPKLYKEYLRKDLAIFVKLFFELNYVYLNENHHTWH